MGGETKTTNSSQNEYPIELRRLMGERADVASALTPELKALFLNVLGGGDAGNKFTDAYVSSIGAPIEKQTSRTVDEIRRNTPAGGRQDFLVGEALQKGGMTRGTEVGRARSGMKERILQMMMALYGMPIQPTGVSHTSTQKSPTPISFQTPFGGAAFPI